MQIDLQDPEHQANGDQRDNERNKQHLLMMALPKDCGRIVGCFRLESQFNFRREMCLTIPIFRSNHPLPAVALAFNLPVRFTLGNHVANDIAHRPPAVRASRFRAVNMLTRRISKPEMSLLRIFFRAAVGANPNGGIQIREHRKRLGKWYGLAK